MHILSITHGHKLISACASYHTQLPNFVRINVANLKFEIAFKCVSATTCVSDPEGFMNNVKFPLKTRVSSVPLKA